MLARDAFVLLGLRPGAAPAEIRAAFRGQVKGAHPDTGGGSSEVFNRLVVARGIALSYAKNETCPYCYGVGHTSEIVGFVPVALRCRHCEGTGRKWQT